MSYNAPTDDIAFILERVAGLGRLEGRPGMDAFDPELVAPILEEAGKLSRDILAPLNAEGDRIGAQLTADGVKTAPGFAEAYGAFRDGGWMGLAFPEEFGGQGLPKGLALAVMEMVHGANMSFGLCPLLTFGRDRSAHRARHAAPAGDVPAAAHIGRVDRDHELTEPQAGSDVGALKTRAVANGDGSYALSGQKIYITWGDHDMAENIIHLVLAPPAGRARGLERRLPLRGAQEARECGRVAGAAQWRDLYRPGKEARHPCQPDLRDGV